MDKPKSQEKPEEFMLRLVGEFVRTLAKLALSVALGVIVVGKFVFDGLSRGVVEPYLEKKRKMREEAALPQDSPHDESR